jgi:ribosomal protein S18 acetylase RimI-like enzyme
VSGEDAASFAALHEPELSQEEAKWGIILNNLTRARAEQGRDLICWTLGAPGQCALRLRPYSIVLGALDRRHCRDLAEHIADTDYPGVMGADDTALWFVERAKELGIGFREPEQLLLYSLGEPPRYPGVSGYARQTTIEDLQFFAEWLDAFYREAAPDDVPPSPDETARMAARGDFLLWIDGARPVSMATITRRLKVSAAITSVYTPSESRGRGYAGSVTAAIVERIFAEGRRTACLYTRAQNPASNRCYQKIGFRPVCRSVHVHRVMPT